MKYFVWVPTDCGWGSWGSGKVENKNEYIITIYILKYTVEMDLMWELQPRDLSSRKRKRDNENFDKNKKLKQSKIFGDDKMIYVVENELHFTSQINKENIEKVIRKITKIIQKNHKKYEGTDKKFNITYIVDSPGGCVTSILKFVDFINEVKKKYKYLTFTSIITGLVASAGTIMCSVADKKLMTKNAHAMIHELSSGNSGKYTHIQSYSNYLTKLHDKLVDIYLNGTNGKQTKESLEKLLLNETWYDAQGYLDNGFIDAIIL